MTILLNFLLWLFIWWLIGAIPVILYTFFCKDSGGVTVGDICFSIFGPIAFLFVIFCLLSDNQDVVIFKRNKKAP